MKNTFVLFLSLSFFIFSLNAQEFQQEEVRITRLVEGTLLVPEVDACPLVIIIAGSGPTDRDGNQPMMKNNSLRFLAEELYKKDIASFRYDKRILKQIELRTIDEKQLRFSDFIDDAVSALNHFKNDERFSKIYIIGHSEGSLIGMVAAQEGADGFISLAGAGQEIDDVIVDQLKNQAPFLADSAREAFDDIRATGKATNFNPGLASIFREEIQPYLLSWMQYNPQEELKKLDVPILLINGDKDFQVQLSELELLTQAKPKAQSKVIEGMNHIFKKAEDMGLENQKTYNIYNLPVMPELIDAISEFILR